MFAAYGLPHEIVSDKDSHFTYQEFGRFLRLNGVKHTLCPAYHPATNGLAERNVQTFKKMLPRSSCHLPLQHRLSDILFQYRNTQHPLTDKTPADLFLNRASRTRLALSKPSLESKVQYRRSKQKQLHDGAHSHLRMSTRK